MKDVPLRCPKELLLTFDHMHTNAPRPQGGGVQALMLHAGAFPLETTSMWSTTADTVQPLHHTHTRLSSTPTVSQNVLALANKLVY